MRWVVAKTTPHLTINEQNSNVHRAKPPLGHRARGIVKRAPNEFRGGLLALMGLTLGYVSIVTSAVIVMKTIETAVSVRAALRRPFQRMEAKNLALQANLGIKSYDQEYHQLPTDLRVPGRDGELPNAVVMDILRNMNSPRNSNYVRNPRRIIFFEARPTLFSNGTMLDPWGRPFHIAVDGDGDGKVTIGTKPIPATIAVWSDGLNGIDENGGGDDVKSW